MDSSAGVAVESFGSMRISPLEGQGADLPELPFQEEEPAHGDDGGGGVEHASGCLGVSEGAAEREAGDVALAGLDHE